MKELIRRIALTQPELAAELRRAAVEVHREAFLVGWMTGIQWFRDLDEPFKPFNSTRIVRCANDSRFH